MKLFRTIFYLFITLTSLSSYSQLITRKTIKIDKIKSLIETANHDTIKIQILKQLSDIAFLNDTD